MNISVDRCWTEIACLHFAQANALQIQEEITSRFGDKAQHLKPVLAKAIGGCRQGIC
jgi:hypothetical protein